MTSPRLADQNYIKFVEIYNVLKSEHDHALFLPGDKEVYLKAIINNDFDINYKLPIDCLLTLNKPHYSGNTLLHFVIEFYNHTECINNLGDICFDLLIKYGADCTIQNNSGYTPLLLAFTKTLHISFSTILSKLINYYIETGADINERVHDNSPKFAGYTPLHFATHYSQLETIELLLNNGASLNIKDVNGMTPLHLLIKNLIQHNVPRDNKIWKILQNALCNNLFNLPDNVGLTYTHSNCILGNFKSLDQNLDIHTPINLDSPFYPGYTPLHFAAHCNFETVILLLEAGANLLIQDSYGVTPLDLCAKNFTLDNIFKIMSAEKQHQLSKLKFKNGASVLDTLPAMSKHDKFEQYLKDMFGNINTFVPFELPIWPGCTLLHIAVKLNGPVSIILSRGASFTIQDANGMSPLHIAFRMMKVETVSTILDFHMSNPVNPVDRNNLSHLHMACAAGNYKVAQRLLENGADLNLPTLCDIQWKLSRDCNVIKAGSTPVHIAIHHLCTINDDFDATVHLSRMINCNFLKVLQKYRANFNIADKNNMTPYHIVLKYQCERIFSQMLKCDQEFDRKKTHEKLGLTKLQIGCFIQNFNMVKRELEIIENQFFIKEDVNKQISFDSPYWPGDTAFHILYRKQFESRNKFVDLLLVHGADPSLRNASNSTPIHLSKGEIFNSPYFLLKSNFYRQNPVNNQGQSHFHMSCITGNLHVTKKFLKSGVDINTPVDYFADRDAGYTPLHWAVKCKNSKFIEFLLIYGADRNIEAYGFTPLHLAVSLNFSDQVDMLLSYGADPNIKDINGFTPLHLAVSLNVINQVKILLRYSTLDIQATNIHGKTALEMALDCNSVNEQLLILLLEKGASVEFARIINKKFDVFIHAAASQLTPEVFRQLIINQHQLTVCDSKGQNAMHHLALCYIDHDDSFTTLQNVIILLERGCEINHKNNKGKTPLHLAASSENLEMIHILVEVGADISIKDDDLKVPYSYIFNEDCKLVFIKQVRKMEAVGLYVQMDLYDKKLFDLIINHNLAFGIEDLSTIHRDKIEFDSWLKKEISPKYSAAYVFSEKFVKDYGKIPKSRRQKLRSSGTIFPELFKLIKIQFIRGRTRNRFLTPALNSFQTVTGLNIPEICCEILDYLDTNSLMNLVRAVNGKLEFPLLPKDVVDDKKNTY